VSHGDHNLSPTCEDHAVFRIAGTYLEACNCEAVCPCRRVDGTPGGRSTYGVCLGALSWRIEEGGTEDAELAGLGSALALRYSDDEPRSPWTFVLYVDRNADEAQRAALEAIFLGRLGGTPQEQFPWVFKPATLLAVRPAEIEIEHTRRRPWFRVDGRVTVRALDPVADQGTVTCVIPGHHRDGREFVAENLQVTEDEPLRFGFAGRCAYAASFEYRG
jgi:hypothetical protein